MFAKPECLLAMKCQALRPDSSDWKDTLFLLQQLNVRSMEQLITAVAAYFDTSNLGNDELVSMKIVIASAFPAQTEYEPLRRKALQLYAQAKMQ